MFVTHHNPHPRAPTRPSTPQVLQMRERTTTPFVVFTLGLALESIKEFGGASSIMWGKCGSHKMM
jgi:hypothetical protein